MDLNFHPMIDELKALLDGLRCNIEGAVNRMQLLIRAVMQGSINETREILNLLKTTDSSSEYRLMLVALEKHQIDIAKLLIENGFCVHVNLKSTIGTTVLHAAVESSDDAELISALLTKGASQDILVPNKDDKTPLHLAIDNNQSSTIKLFLSQLDIETLDDKNLLHYAIKQGRIKLVTELIQKGLSLKKKNEENLTPFCIAWNNKNFEMMHHLLSFCTEENIKSNNYDDIAPVYIASMCGYLELVKKYTDFGLSINRPLKPSNEPWSCLTNSSGFTLLHFAVKHIKFEVIKFLLSTGADILVQDDDGSTPLHIAFEFKERGIWDTWQQFDDNNSIIDLILKINMKLKCHPVNKNGLSHFHIASSRDEPTVVEHFLKLGATINQQTKPQCHLYKGFYPLHFAAKFRCKNTLELLLKNGADVKQSDFNNMTALHIAAKESCLDGVRLLLEHGADITSIDSYGNSPLHLAFENRNYAVIDLLLSVHSKVHLNPTDIKGLSHFHIACTRSNVHVAKSFIEDGVMIDKCVPDQSSINSDLNVPDWAGYSPLHLAVCHNRVKIVQLLLNSGASVKIKDSNYGSTPLHLACQYGYEMFGEFIKTTLYDFKKREKIALQLKPITDVAEVFENYINGFSDCTGKFNWLANRRDHLKIIDLLLNYRSDVNSMDSMNNTPVFYAYAAVADITRTLENNLNDCAEMLLKQIVESLTKELCERRNLILNNLVKLDVNLDKCHRYGSILHYICAKKNADEHDEKIMRLFLENCANVNLYNQCYFCKMSTPLHVATESRNENLITTLLEYDANVDCIYPMIYDRTPLLITTFEKMPLLSGLNIMKILIDKGANVNARQSDGKTVLHGLSLRNVGHFGSYYIATLIKAGANINSQDYRGLTPLHLTCLKLNYLVAEGLLQYGADINAQNYEGHGVCYYLYLSYLKNISISRRDDLSDNMKWTIKLLQNHIMKINAIGLPVSEMELWSCAKFYDHMPRTDQEKKELIDKYQDEIQVLQYTKINGYFTLHDVIFKNENALSKLVKNRKFKAIVESKSFKQTYPNYGYLIQLKYHAGVDRAKLLPTAKCVLKSLVGLHLPDSCSENIFNYFTNCELNESIQNVSKLLNLNAKSSVMQLRNRRSHKHQKIY